MTEIDEVIVDLGFARPGHLERASVQYRAHVRGRWRSVIRYDNAHGQPHCHRFWAKKIIRPPPKGTGPTRLIELAKVDLKKNWTTYRRRMEAMP
jgi:hypothetical protein